MTDSQTAHGWQFSLRTLIGVMLAAALATFGWKFFYYLGAWGQFDGVFWPILIAVAFLAWNIGQTGPPILAATSVTARRLAIVWLSVFGLIVAYLIWARSAALEWGRSPYLYSFPHPDSWLPDLRSCVRSATEDDPVHAVLSYAVWCSGAIFAFQSGLWFRVDHRKLLERLRYIIFYWPRKE